MRPFATFLLSAALAAAGCGRTESPGPVNPAPESAGPADPPPFTGETVENPQYKSWARFKKGTTVVHRSVTETAGTEGKTVTTTTYKLLNLTPEFAFLQSQAATVRYDGFKTDNPPDSYKVFRLIPLPPGVKKEDFGKPATGAKNGEETITVGGKEFKTTWYKGNDRNEGGEVSIQVWSSPEVPGALVKSFSRTAGVEKITAIELVEVKQP